MLREPMEVVGRFGGIIFKLDVPASDYFGGEQCNEVDKGRRGKNPQSKLFFSILRGH
jgi:hypothetical protein|tara:strand:- start:366 stop:536 length:171 start_codon:yes stop_codon:yes gene_type:complete